MTAPDYWQHTARLEFLGLVQQLRPAEALEVLQRLADTPLVNERVPAVLLGFTQGVVQRRQDEKKAKPPKRKGWPW